MISFFACEIYLVVYYIASIDHVTNCFLLSRNNVASKKATFFIFVSATDPSNQDNLIHHLEKILGPSNSTFQQHTFRTISLEHHQNGMSYEIFDCSQNVYGETFDTAGTVTEYRDSQDQRVAILTDFPILDSSQILKLRDATSRWWKINSTTSRYTYRRASNLEVHLLDICKANITILHMTRQILCQRIYPMIEKYFSMDPQKWRLSLYDSLFLRYDASCSKFGASLPWHRDLGLVSVNILLNDDFEGGGTMFDSICDGVPIQSPSLTTMGGRVGHALFHESNYRHAAAPTTRGIRDIWVMFVTAFPSNNTGMHHQLNDVKIQNDHEEFWSNTFVLPPNQEVAIRLKMKAREEDNLWNRARLLKLAIDMVPKDGEAWHHLGMTLHELGGFPRESRACLSRATKWIPMEASLFHNFAVVLAQQSKLDTTMTILDMEKRIEVCFQRALQLKQDNLEFDTTVFNYATYLAHHERWEEAMKVLQTKRGNYEVLEDDNLKNNQLDIMLSELKRHCYDKISSKPHER
jgi:hypothetical protein